jgi:hypothetical protein
VQDLVLEKSDLTLYVDEQGTNSVYTGNGSYTISGSDNGVAKASIETDGSMTITPVAAGKATFTVADGQQKTTTFNVTVNRHLVLDYPNDTITVLNLDEPLVIHILDGNGGYTQKASSTTYAGVALDGTTITITGKRVSSANTSITISDQAGVSRLLRLMYVDNAYLSNSELIRVMLCNTKFQNSKSYPSKVVHTPEFGLSQIEVRTGSSATSGGYALRFTGDLTVGDKTEGMYFPITKGVVMQDQGTTAYDVKVDQVQPDANGDTWYWVSFLYKKNDTTRSYFVVKQAQ